MTWEQLYALSTPEERLEILFHMAQTIEARQSQIIFARGRLIRNRRGAFRGAHFINQRRRRFIPRPIYLSTFMFTITATSIAVWISFFKLPPAYAAPLMLLHLSALSAILFIKPYKPHVYAT
jgi:hypothetical protein